MRSRGFTLIEVLVALVIVAIGLAAMMVTISSTARTTGYLRDKTLAQWIALNRISEVRLNLKSGQNADTGQISFANRTWHYDTRYFDTSISTMKRVVVRVYPGDSKSKGNPLAESTGFMGSALGTPGSSNVDWTPTSAPATSAAAAAAPTATPGTTTSPTATAPGTLPTPTPAPTPTPTPTPTP